MVPLLGLRLVDPAVAGGGDGSEYPPSPEVPLMTVVPVEMSPDSENTL